MNSTNLVMLEQLEIGVGLTRLGMRELQKFSMEKEIPKNVLCKKIWTSVSNNLHYKHHHISAKEDVNKQTNKHCISFIYLGKAITQSFNKCKHQACGIQQTKTYKLYAVTINLNRNRNHCITNLNIENTFLATLYY